MKYFLSVFCLCCYCISFSQSDSLQHQIDEQVWKPFIESFNNDDNTGFRKVHSLDLIRVVQDNNQVLGYDEYLKPVDDSIKAKWGEWKHHIELRFIQRIALNGKAFDVGYYKTTSTNISAGETRVSFGKFHVLLRTENGVWKILMDQDAKEDADEKKFSAAQAME
ncbi:MAG TPA: hypothetical protein VFW07_29125 [Parafilimonas sp.]|nr:hypothetical protein [Parafilimonas sp.]